MFADAKASAKHFVTICIDIEGGITSIIIGGDANQVNSLFLNIADETFNGVNSNEISQFLGEFVQGIPPYIKRLLNMDLFRWGSQRNYNANENCGDVISWR